MTRRTAAPVTTAATAAFVLAAVVIATPARAEKDACITSYEQTQSLRKDAKLLEAKAQATICARESCPAVLARDCTKWVGEIEAATPTVVLEAKTPEGRDLVDVRVKLDGARLSEKMDGKAIPIDPGTHTFVYEADGREIEKILIIREGEKNRPVLATMPAAVAAHDTLYRPGHEKVARPVPLGVWVFGGASVAALATTAIFAASGLSKKSDLDACKPTCGAGDVDSMSARFTVADVALGAGVLAGAAAIWLFVTRPTLSTSETSGTSGTGGETGEHARVEPRKRASVTATGVAFHF